MRAARRAVTILLCGGGSCRGACGAPQPDASAAGPVQAAVAPEREDVASAASAARQRSLAECFESDVAIWGYDLSTPRVIVPSAEACQRRCQQVDSCLFFSWAASDGGCYAKSADAERQMMPGTTSGPRACRPQEFDSMSVEGAGAAAGAAATLTGMHEAARDRSYLEQVDLSLPEAVDQLDGGDNFWLDVPLRTAGPTGAEAGDIEVESMPPIPPLPPLPTATSTAFPTPAPTWAPSSTAVSTSTMPAPTPHPIPATTATPHPIPATTATTSPTSAPKTTAPSTTSTTTKRDVTPSDPPLFTCPINCYGPDSVAVPVALGPNGDASTGTSASTVEECRKLCIDSYDSDGQCGGVVYGDGTCWGKNDIHTSRCQSGDGTYVTQFVTSMQFGTCSILGDPHIVTFDNAMNNSEEPDVTVTDQGQYPLVIAEGLLIHGKFGYTQRFPSAACLVGIAAEGSAIGGNKLVVVYEGPAQGVEGFKVLWNGEQILQSGIGATFTGDNLKAECNNMDPTNFAVYARSTYGGTSGLDPSYLFQIDGNDSPPDLQIYLLVGEDAMNAVITMRKAENGQDGFCGNFNCEPADDVFDKLKERGFNQSLHEAESLFAGAPRGPDYQRHRSGEVPSIAKCPEDVLAQAKVSCAGMGIMRHGCIFDKCAEAQIARARRRNGSNIAAAQTAVEVNGAALGLPGLISAPAWIQATMVFGALCLFFVGMALGPGLHPRRRRSQPYELASSDDDGAERESSRTVRTGLVSGRPLSSDHSSAPLFTRWRASAAGPLAGVLGAAPTSLAAPAEAEGVEGSMLHPIAFEHDPL